MIHLLIVYKRSAGKPLEMREFPESGRLEANAARFEREIQYKADKDVEVVVLSAQSREDLKRTHGRYFRTDEELRAPFGLVPAHGH